MTIEERIDNAKKQYVYPNFPTCSEDYLNGFETGYIICATDQKKIDIEKGKKFCKAWLDEIIDIYLPDLKGEPYYTQALELTYKKFEKAMEE